MLKFRNRLTHSLMYVAEDRKEEYLEAGHTLASDDPVPVEEEQPIVEKKPKRTAKRGK